MGDKIYIVASTCEAIGFELENILHPFKNKEDAQNFLMEESHKIEDQLRKVWDEDEWVRESCDLQRYFAKNKYGNWYDILLMEMDVR